MSKRRKTAQAMSDEAKIAAARKKIVALGLDEKEIMPKLLEKYGVLAYDFVNKAAMEPGRLCNRTGEKFLATKKLISHYAEDDIEPAILAKAVNKKPEEVKAKAIAYRAEHAQDEETKPAEVREIERTAEIKYVQVKNEIDHRSNIPVLSIDQLMNLHSYRGSGFVENSEQKPEGENGNVSILRPEYDPNTPEGRAKKKAQERLAELKDGKDGELSFAELKKNGVSKTDMCAVMTKDRLCEVSSSERMIKQATAAERTVAPKRRCKNKGGRGQCAKATANNVERCYGPDSTANYRPLKNKVPETFWRNPKTKRVQSTQATATAQIYVFRKSDELVCFDYESKPGGDPELRENVKALGTMIGYPGDKTSVQPAGHTTTLGPKGWCSDDVDPEDWLFGGGAAKRYAPKGGTGTVSVIFDKDATVSDQMAEDMLYQQYLREENLMYKKLAMNHDAAR